jgi:hypothetical protein
VIVAALGGATVLATSMTAFATSVTPSSTSGGCASTASNASKAHHMGKFGGVVNAMSTQTGCQAVSGDSQAAVGQNAMGTPPLLYHGGPVMSTSSTGALVITPIFWNPPSHPMTDAYKNILTQYIADVAKDSPQKSNVFSVATEYSGTNGSIRYRVSLGSPINDTSPLPKDGCKLEHQDTTAIYADNSGYNSCLDDDQVIAETDRVVTASGLPRDLAHIYVLYLPKGTESCFFPGATKTSANACTINYQPSAAYCAYHSQAPSSTVYALMAYPIYHSPVGFTCGSDARVAGFGGVIQAPNGNPDADTETSPTSHEVNEAMTDPDTVTGWYDSSGFENGDECAYTYGPVSGTPGQFSNQTINHHQYLTQEEFSNKAFNVSGSGGCLQNSMPING